MATLTTVLISGNTYPVKEEIKALGGRWDAAVKGWRVPATVATQAKALVRGAPKSTATRGTYRPPKCCVCGHVEQRQGSHGQYPDPDRILRSGECVSCYEERKMGY